MKESLYKCRLCGKGGLTWVRMRRGMRLFDGGSIHKCLPADRYSYLIKRIEEYSRQDPLFDTERFLNWYSRKMNQFLWEWNYGVKPIKILNKMMKKDRHG